MGTSVVVNQQSFEADVLRSSFERPVLVDFFAQWCGPCKMLKPLLETLSQEYDFVLAKVDIDENPALAKTYKVEGVPDVRVVVNGEMQSGFVGMMAEPQLREFLGRLNLASALEQMLGAIAQAQQAGQWEETEALYTQLVTQFPSNMGVKLEAAQFFLSRDRIPEAEAALADISAHDKEVGAQAEALRSLVQLHREMQAPMLATPSDQAYAAAAQHLLAGEYEAALQGWLELVARDRQYRQDGSRKALLMVFALLGDDHPLTFTYRRKLMSALY